MYLRDLLSCFVLFYIAHCGKTSDFFMHTALRYASMHSMVVCYFEHSPTLPAHVTVSSSSLQSVSMVTRSFVTVTLSRKEFYVLNVSCFRLDCCKYSRVRITMLCPFCWVCYWDKYVNLKEIIILIIMLMITISQPKANCDGVKRYKLDLVFFSLVYICCWMCGQSPCVE